MGAFPVPNDDAAIQFMITDIIEQTLAHAENPAWLAEYLTRQIREIIGGKIVVLMQCHQTCSMSDHRVISVCPARHIRMADMAELGKLAELSHSVRQAEIWSPSEGPLDAREILREKGWGVSVVLPLNLGEKRFGVLFVLNLLQTHRLSDTLAMFEMMPNVIALVLKNSLMYEELENRINARTEELARLNEELEERVRRRTAELEASNRELESFCYSVSHDLRSPLRGIDGWSQAIAEDYADKLDDHGRKYLERIRGEARRMAQLIDDLLNMSRLTRSELQFGTVNLSELAYNVSARLRESDPKRSAEFVIQQSLTAQADAGMMEIVLTNLIGNAWKFTGKTLEATIDFGKLNPEVVRSEDRGKQIFFVRDNGAGFDMAYASKLFGAFQRLHKTSEFPGTGIGLAIVQRIIHRHGGRVWAEGAVNQGATFYFTL